MNTAAYEHHFVLWLTTVTCLAYHLDKEPWKAIESLIG